LAGLLASCEPVLTVGDVVCPPSEGGVPTFDANGAFKGCQVPSVTGGGGTSESPGAGGASGEMSEGGHGADNGEVCPEGGATGDVNGSTPLTAPWATSFEAGFCRYDDGGFCYSDANSSYRIVTSPVRTGGFAAAFEMSPSTDGGARQTRCVRQGVLPVEAYYGAWYYVPSELAGAHAWNLFHFQGGQAGKFLHGLWDVSVNDEAGNGYAAFIYDTVHDGHYGQVTPKPIPRDRWFQLELYLKRAADTTGEVALYQDGEELVRRTGIVTDDTPFGEWYVGNYTTALEPTASAVTVYVDDVTVRLP
jgi:hypothetical protein